jgi:prepilin-type N-terminal cleavage/methylation domain-containing protein
MAELTRPNRPANHFNGPRGFTLIELLIVVAIIAILAAIAVPNFLQAQTRSKYSRVLSDFRTMRVGVESYAVDWNRPPAMTWGTSYQNSAGRTVPEARYNGERIYGTLGPFITTPVAYLSRFDFLDPFVDKKVGSVSMDARLYTYQDLATNQLPLPYPTSGSVFATVRPSLIDYALLPRELGSYWTLSIGPSGNDELYFRDFYTQYDASNGTISAGTIYTSQKSSNPTQMNFQL